MKHRRFGHKLNDLKLCTLISFVLYYPFAGKLSTLKRGADDISSAKKETECGVTLENFKGFEEGDIIQCVTINYLKQEIDWDWGF